MKKQCPETCPECRGRGEVDLLTKVVPCSQPWAARGGPIPLSKVSSLVESLAPQVKERLAESFRQAYPGARLLEQMASQDGEAFRREHQGDFVPRHKPNLALQFQSIVERHGGSMTIDDRGPGNCVVHIELLGQRFENVPTGVLHRLFNMHLYGAGARKLVEALDEAFRERRKPNIQTNPCAEIPLPTEELLFLGGPKHGQFIACGRVPRLDCYGDEERVTADAFCGRMSSRMEIHSYEAQHICLGGRVRRVMILRGDDIGKHVSFLNKVWQLFKENR